MSAACSTGRVTLGPGGTHLGLEQGFLTRGGGALVSPLWNVDQAASMHWLLAFYRHHEAGRLDDLATAHRAACLETMRKYPHPFAWSPFVLNRRLQGGDHP